MGASFMIAELGQFILSLAFIAALVQSLAPWLGKGTSETVRHGLARQSALAACFLIILAFGCLTALYILSDFSVLNVAQNSHTDKPMLYKITGVWGNHEGSLLLWIMILALFGALMAVFGKAVPLRMHTLTLGMQGILTLSFLAFMLFTSNPFWRLVPVPVQGQGLNVLLQDIGLAVHPPLLYLGYVGLSISFAFAVAALIEGRLDRAFASWIRPWVLVAWLFLTLGIAMGSYWAYYELGWGGWWFWDPVENASLLPWLAATALLHCVAVMQKRDALKIWTVLLALLAFSLSLLGTFLVRSGVLTSVHSFATDPTRGMVILIMLGVVIGGSLLLFAVRAPLLRQGGVFAPLSREGALVFNNIFLTASLLAVLIGTLYPLALEAVTGDKISVGPPFFNLTFLPIVTPLLLVLPFGPLLAWKKGDLYAAGQRLMVAFALALGVIVVMLIMLEEKPVLAALAVGLAVWLMAGAVTEPLTRAGFPTEPLGLFWVRLKGLPASLWGSAVAHFGVGVMVLGIAASTAFQKEAILVMQVGTTTTLAGFELTLDTVRQVNGPNYRDIVPDILVRTAGALKTRLHPAKRTYQPRNQPTTEVALYRVGLFSQLYASPGNVSPDGQGLVMRFYYKPLVLLIWIGAVIMAFGSVFSLWHVYRRRKT
jgi:cytochrome c-type biogenesis protein CcmF